MLRRQTYCLILVGALIGVPAGAGERPQLTGYVRNYMGVLTEMEGDFAIIQNAFDMKLDYRGDRVGFLVNPRLYHYPGEDPEIQLREAYLDMFLGPVDIRLGKQQIIWGKGEGVFITDIVSPKDMREFLLPEFDEIRIGVNALKVNYYLGNHSFEVALLPQFVPTMLPEEGSIWRRQPSARGASQVDLSRSDVPLRVDNGEIFGRYSLLGSWGDIDLMGGYMWDDDPTMHLVRTVNPETGTLSRTVTPRHHRLTVGGAAFSTLLGEAVFRGEGAWYGGKYFSSNSPADVDGVVEKNYVNYLTGLDCTIWETRFSGQFIQTIILDYESGIRQREFENMATMLVRRDFLRETLTLELFAYIGLDQPDALLRPRVVYDIADGFEIQAGVNLFLGEAGRFGTFDENDMVYMKTKFSF